MNQPFNQAFQPSICKHKIVSLQRAKENCVEKIWLAFSTASKMREKLKSC